MVNIIVIVVQLLYGWLSLPILFYCCTNGCHCSFSSTVVLIVAIIMVVLFRVRMVVVIMFVLFRVRMVVVIMFVLFVY